MEIKKIFTTAIGTALMLAGIYAYAADDVIYESGRVETAGEYKDLDGWGRELYTKCIFEADVRFKEEGSGITLRSADNMKEGTSIKALIHKDKLTLAADGGAGSPIYYIEIDPASTYHISLIGSYGVSNGVVDMTVDIYGEDGSIADTKTYYLILMNNMFASSGVGPEHIRIEANTIADNIKVTELKPDSIRLVSPPGTVTPGSKTTISAKPQREGADFDYELPIEYSVSGEGVSVSRDGVLSVSQNAPEETFTVTAASGDLRDTAEISVISGEIFTINSAVFNEDNTVLRSVGAVKNYFYDGTAVFIVTVYNPDGLLKDSFMKYVPAKSIALKKDTEIVIGYDLPEDFDAVSDMIEIQAWSAGAAAKIEAPSDEVEMRQFFENNGGAVEWIGAHGVVEGVLNGRTVVSQINNPTVFIDSIGYTLTSAPYINESDSTVISGELIELMLK